jgi:hypothetical protein
VFALWQTKSRRRSNRKQFCPLAEIIVFGITQFFCGSPWLLGQSFGLHPAIDDSTSLWGFKSEFAGFSIPPQFQRAGDFAAGLAPVRVGEEWGYVNSRGELVISPRFSSADVFAEGLAAVIENGSLIYIDVKDSSINKLPISKSAGVR